MDGHTAKLQDFLSVQRLDYFSKMMKTIKRFLDSNGISKPLWLGETSSAYGGGAHGLSDRYGKHTHNLDNLNIKSLTHEIVQNGNCSLKEMVILGFS